MTRRSVCQNKTFSILKLKETHSFPLVSRSELEALHDQFLKRSGSDNMNLQEFSKQMQAFGLTDQALIKKTFEVFDSDGNGFVDFR